MNLILAILFAVCLAIVVIIFWQGVEEKSFNDLPFDDVKKREDEQRKSQNSGAAETIVTRIVKGYPKREWAKTRPRNDALDIRAYSLAASRAWQHFDHNYTARPRRWHNRRGYMSVDNPTNIPPIDLNQPHQHRCAACGDGYHCTGPCEPDDIFICAACEERG